MKIVNIHAAKTHLSRLVDDVAGGAEIVIARAGRPIARLVPLESPPPPRTPGLLRGRLRIARDFDAPLSGDALQSFATPIEPKTRRS